MDISHVKFNRETRYIPMVGYPMGHAIAPVVYNKLFNCLGLNLVMWPLETEPAKLHKVLEASDVMKMDKIALTMPHKSAIIPLLDHVDPCSRLFNSVNTVKIVDGESYGIGMDGVGCVGAVKERTTLAGKSVMILGAGSISGAIGYQLAQEGVAHVSYLNRNLENAEKVANILKENTTISVSTFESTPENLDAEAAKADIFLQCSPLGMLNFGADHAYLGFVEKLPKHCVVLEAIMNPLKTTLLQKAEDVGLETIMGVDMTICQMSEIFDYWYGIQPTAEHKAQSRQVLIDFLSK